MRCFFVPLKKEKEIKEKDVYEVFRCRYLLALGVIPSVNFFTALKSTDDLSTSLLYRNFFLPLRSRKRTINPRSRERERGEDQI